MMKNIAAWILSLAILTAGMPLAAAAEEPAGNYDKLGERLVEEIEKGTAVIPVYLDMALDDAESEKIFNAKKELEAMEETTYETHNALYTQARAAWDQFRSGSSTQEAYQAVLAEKDDAYKAATLAYEQAREQYQNETKGTVEAIFREKLKALGIEAEMHCTSIGNGVREFNTLFATGNLQGELTPAQILMLSEDADLNHFNYDSTAEWEPVQPFQPTMTVPDYVSGDFNNDKEVNASDAAKLLNYAARHGAGDYAASFSAYVRKGEPTVIQTDKFLYYSTAPHYQEDLEGLDGWEGTQKLVIPETDADYLVTGILQYKDDPFIKNYITVTVNDSIVCPVILNYWHMVPGGETLQVGDLISLKNLPVVETYPGQVDCGLGTDYVNYGNACELLGEEFRDVIREQIIQTNVWAKPSDHYDMLPVPESLSDWQEMSTEPHALYGDYNRDDVVNASDAAIVLIYSAAKGAGTFTGTFEEYVNR